MLHIIIQNLYYYGKKELRNAIGANGGTIPSLAMKPRLFWQNGKTRKF